LRINYTAYKLQHNQDSINVSTYAEVMIQGKEGAPDCYACIVGIYHTIANLWGHVEPYTIDFLLVCWLVMDMKYPTSKWLPAVKFLDVANDNAFGIVHSDAVIWTV
jgi:hypothetical protein